MVFRRDRANSPWKKNHVLNNHGPENASKWHIIIINHTMSYSFHHYYWCVCAHDNILYQIYKSTLEYYHRSYTVGSFTRTAEYNNNIMLYCYYYCCYCYYYYYYCYYISGKEIVRGIGSSSFRRCTTRSRPVDPERIVCVDGGK